jgi:hypothetical protein
MNNSTFREPWQNLDLEPMSARLEENMSTGYTWENGGFEAGVFEFIHQVGPAGALSATATDMARWMLMHLGEGAYNGVQILAPETARLMHQRHFTHDEEISGWAHGFIEGRIGGYRTFGHDGGTLYFLSQMVMVPDLGFGLFASSNTASGMQVVGDLASIVVERYFPVPEETADIRPPEDFADRGKRFAGTYISTRRPYTKVEKLPMLIMSPLQVSVTDDGYLVIGSGDNALRLVEVAPLTFRAVNGKATVKFVENARGRITGMIPDGPMYLDRAGLFESSSTIIGVAVVSLLACLGVLIAAWYRRTQRIEQSTGERFASVMLVLTAATWILFFLVFGVAMAGMASDLAEVMFDFPPSTMVWALVIALVCVVETLACIALLYPVWSNRSWGLGRRLRHTLVVLMMAVFVLLLSSLNMIGFKYF